MNEKILDEFIKPQHFSDKEIFIKIWTEPKNVLSFIHETKHDKFVKILLVLAGITKAFDQAVMKNMGDRLSLTAIIMGCLIFGGLFGWIINYIYAALITWTGQWLNGQGETDSILRIIAYGMFPTIFSVIFIIPQISIYGIDFFQANGDILSAGLISNIIFYSSLILEFVFSICSIVFCTIGISIVQKISIGKAVLNLILPVILIFVVIFVIAFLFLGV